MKLTCVTSPLNKGEDGVTLAIECASFFSHRTKPNRTRLVCASNLLKVFSLHIKTSAKSGHSDLSRSPMRREAVMPNSG